MVLGYAVNHLRAHASHHLLPKHLLLLLEHRSAEHGAKIAELLKHEGSHHPHPLLDAIRADSGLLALKSRWVVGADDWARDLADSGVHHVISSGENVKVLIIDTQPYSRPSQNKCVVVPLSFFYVSRFPPCSCIQYAAHQTERGSQHVRGCSNRGARPPARQGRGGGGGG